MKFLISHRFNQPVANTTLWVYESFVNLEYFVWDVVWMNWKWRRLSPQFLPSTSPNHYSTNALLSLTPVVCNNPYQAAHYHILCIQVVGIISNLTHGWLQNSEVFILHKTHTKDYDRHNMSMCVMFTGYQGQAMIKIIIKVNLHHVPVLPLDNLSCLYPQQDEH